MNIYSVTDAEFRSYGQVLTGYDFTELFAALSGMPCPEKGIRYEPSVPELENCAVFSELKNRGFGAMPIQAGYCSGTNNQLNCLEYHKSSEFNIAGDDIVLLLGHIWQITDGKFDTADVKAFYVPAGTGVELFGTTLHYAPCGKGGKGFRVVCILPKDTNLARPEMALLNEEDTMCFGSNKWLLAHPSSDAAKKGAYVGLCGENPVCKGE